MGNEIMLQIETGFFKYPYLRVVFDGTKTENYFRDLYLRESIWKAIKEATDDKDIYDFAMFIFSSVNNAVKRHYNGQTLMLSSVEAIADNWEISITIKR